MWYAVDLLDPGMHQVLCPGLEILVPVPNNTVLLAMPGQGEHQVPKQDGAILYLETLTNPDLETRVQESSSKAQLDIIYRVHLPISCLQVMLYQDPGTQVQVVPSTILWDTMCMKDHPDKIK